MTVVIGVDPHKRSHTAVAVDANEVELDRVEVRASVAQVEQLLVWAARFGVCTWAIESAAWATARSSTGLCRPTSASAVEAGLARLKPVQTWSSARFRLVVHSRARPRRRRLPSRGADRGPRTTGLPNKPTSRTDCALWRDIASRAAIVRGASDRSKFRSRSGSMCTLPGIPVCGSASKAGARESARDCRVPRGAHPDRDVLAHVGSTRSRAYSLIDALGPCSQNATHSPDSHHNLTAP
jgi:hypothetical protein